MEVGANLIGMVKTNTKILCKGAIEKFTKDWPGGSYLVKDTSLWYPGTDLLRATTPISMTSLTVVF